MNLSIAVISQGSKSSKMAADAMKKYFKIVDHLEIKDIEVSLGADKPEIIYKGEPIDQYDCLYAKGSFRYANLLRGVTSIIAKSGRTFMPLDPSTFSTGHDKLLTQMHLQANNVPMPKTYLTSSAEAAKTILKKMNYPIIMKFPQGTQGKGVMIADTLASAKSMMDALSALRQPFLLQEYIDTGGVDIRAIVVGDKVVASMKRKAVVGELRANIHAGAKGIGCVLDHHTQKIAVDAAKAIKAQICGVDILESAKGPVVIEVNVSPGLQGITAATKIDVADKIASYLYSKTKEIKESGKKESTKEIFKEIGIPEAGKEMITNLDFRGRRILLPEVVTKLTHFTEKDEVSISADKHTLRIKKLTIGEEKK